MAALLIHGISNQAQHAWDSDQTTELVGTPNWQPPEIPEWTARGEIWVIAAISLSLCRLLPLGPLRPKPAHVDSQTEWDQSADARRGIRDIGTGEAYSQVLEDMLWQCLRFKKMNRPLSYELVVKIRKAEMETLGQKKIKLLALPQWALKDG